MSESGASQDWDELLQRYPTAPGFVQANPEPEWDDLSDVVDGVKPADVSRAIARFTRRQGGALFNDAQLEGIAYTEPEIQALIGGTHVPGHTAGEEFQVADMKRASDYLLVRASEGPIAIGRSISDDLHMFIGAHLNIQPVQFRGDQRLRYDGPEVALGRGERFRALDARLTQGVFDAGLTRINAIEHPVVRGATWAAFAAYEQFYFDGNKRAGRYVMNAVLLSHGFDSIDVPAARKEEYEGVIVDALRTGNLTNHIRFLLALAPASPTKSL